MPIQDQRRTLDKYMVNVREYRGDTDTLAENPNGESRWVRDGLTCNLDDNIPGNLYIMPGDLDMDLFGSDLEQYSTENATGINPTPVYRTYSVLRRMLLALDDSYIVVLDTNPSLNIVTRLALIAAEEIIAPTTYDIFAGGGLSNLFAQLSDTRVGDGNFAITSLRRYRNNGCISAHASLHPACT